MNEHDHPDSQYFPHLIARSSSPASFSSSHLPIHGPDLAESEEVLLNALSAAVSEITQTLDRTNDYSQLIIPAEMLNNLLICMNEIAALPEGEIARRVRDRSDEMLEEWLDLLLECVGDEELGLDLVGSDGGAENEARADMDEAFAEADDEMEEEDGDEHLLEPEDETNSEIPVSVS
ncbi:uncharacterized protein VTP21DRAFT_5920 [Calcarisporiella thermophila]|uniref:uncharacterized protein n=1 Tax=Calcarisporiella thermophila TaxID=911321 RepID=UPI003742DE50